MYLTLPEPVHIPMFRSCVSCVILCLPFLYTSLCYVPFLVSNIPNLMLCLSILYIRLSLMYALDMFKYRLWLLFSLSTRLSHSKHHSNYSALWFRTSEYSSFNLTSALNTIKAILWLRLTSDIRFRYLKYSDSSNRLAQRTSWSRRPNPSEHFRYLVG